MYTYLQVVSFSYILLVVLHFLCLFVSVIPDAVTAQDRSPQPVELRLYRTGFTVDDGPLRDYQEEENVMFLADIKRGYKTSNFLEITHKLVNTTVLITVHQYCRIQNI